MFVFTHDEYLLSDLWFYLLQEHLVECITILLFHIILIKGLYSGFFMKWLLNCFELYLILGACFRHHTLRKWTVL